ncbi:MAG: hypothetical protein M3548_24280 [Actinomycetota bacterium]|nr:hypothetical protein [Actinomycetota bacterium]
MGEEENETDGHKVTAPLGDFVERHTQKRVPMEGKDALAEDASSPAITPVAPEPPD